MHFTILGQGTAVPEHYIERKHSVELAIRNFAKTDRQKKLVPALYRMAGVKKRYSTILKSGSDSGAEPSYDLLYEPSVAEDMGPTVSERMKFYEERSFPLAEQAASQALERAELDPSEITHLVTVSCSGFFAPGVDVKLIKHLGFPATVERAHVGFMGCQGALNGLRVARGFSAHRPDAKVMLCAVELCSLHYHYGWDPEKVVANALFADGSAALIGTVKDEGTPWQIRDTGACLIPDSEDAMTWRIGDNGFEMSLKATVPSLIQAHLAPWLEEWLGRNDLTLSDVKTWAVHPGGPRILSSVANALELPDGALDVSKKILQEYGNMSSPTILFILDRLRTADEPRPCVALAFGPGLMAEATLFV
ncbi:MAG: type III polyketide synthase [Candidatus Hydrogenedentota bacterium]